MQILATSFALICAAVGQIFHGCVNFPVVVAQTCLIAFTQEFYRVNGLQLLVPALDPEPSWREEQEMMQAATKCVNPHTYRASSFPELITRR